MSGQLGNGPCLARVVMPLVRLLLSDNLSWSDRQAIVEAIQSSTRAHADMEKEASHLRGSTASTALQQLQKELGR